jgi:hypothetical protein
MLLTPGDIVDFEIRSDTISCSFQVAVSREEEGEEKEKHPVFLAVFLESPIVKKIDDFEV